MALWALRVTSRKERAVALVHPSGETATRESGDAVRRKAIYELRHVDYCYWANDRHRWEPADIRLTSRALKRCQRRAERSS